VEYNEIFDVSAVVQNLFCNRDRTENQNFLQLVTTS